MKRQRPPRVARSMRPSAACCRQSSQGSLGWAGGSPPHECVCQVCLIRLVRMASPDGHMPCCHAMGRQLYFLEVRMCMLCCSKLQDG